MSKHTSRRWTHAGMVTIAMAIGACLGYVAWLGVTLETTKQDLRLNARRHINGSDRFPTEGRAFLREMNALGDAPCSEADVANFRRLLMKARYVKEAGRMRGSQLACSAILRPSELPQTRDEPSFREADGVLVYTKIKALNMGPLTPIVLRLGDSFVALDPNDRGDIPIGMQFTMTMRNASTGANHLGGQSTPLNGDILTREGYGRSGGSLYATACSLHYPPCTTAVISIKQVLMGKRRQLMIGMVTASAIGCWLGFVWIAFLRLRRGLEHQLRRAIRRDALRVEYQPLVDIVTRRVIGAEALVRWTDQDKVAVAPDIFIKVAEERGFVNEITALVVRRVLADFALYMKANPEFRVNVNVAASDLTDSKFHKTLEDRLQSASVSPQSLGIELTEGATARHEDAIKAIAYLRHRGHKVYIDDFGTGYSSLAYLKDLAVDGIKVDRAFTRAIGTDSVAVGILPQILAMAEVLKLSVVAEGVETEAQSAYYGSSSGPVTGQGWLFGFPVPASEFRDQWLTGSLAEQAVTLCAPRMGQTAQKAGQAGTPVEQELLASNTILGHKNVPGRNALLVRNPGSFVRGGFEIE